MQTTKNDTCPVDSGRPICFGSAFAALEGRERWADAGVDKGKAAELSTGSWRVTARAEWDAVRDLDAVVVQWHEAAYPALLRTLPDAPVLLYCLGDLSLLANPAVAVIGSRKATPRGQALAGHMAGAFASWGITVVSGMAWVKYFQTFSKMKIYE